MVKVQFVSNCLMCEQGSGCEEDERSIFVEDSLLSLTLHDVAREEFVEENTQHCTLFISLATVEKTSEINDERSSFCS